MNTNMRKAISAKKQNMLRIRVLLVWIKRKEGLKKSVETTVKLDDLRKQKSDAEQRDHMP